MYGFLRQNTAATVLAGPFLAPGDGITAKTGLSAPTGAASGAATGSALVKAGVAASYTPSGWAHDRLGYYTVNLGTGDVDTAGRLRLEFVDPANYAPVHMDFVVLPPAVYDGLFGATAGIPALPAAGSIDVGTLTFTLQQLSLRAYFVTTGVTSPVSADQWATGGLDANGVAYYKGKTNGLFAWYNGAGWTISTVVGTNGASYWTTASGGTVVGPYTPQGTATGTPVVTPHGNAVLAGFQPDIALAPPVRVNVVGTGSTTSAVVLDAGASATNNDPLYVGRRFRMTSGALAGQTGVGTSYVASTKTLTVVPGLGGSPASGDGYVIEVVDANTVTFQGATVTPATAPPSAVAIRTEIDSNSTQLAALVAGQTTIGNNVLAINSQAALIRVVVPGQLPLPASGTTAFEFDAWLYDVEGHNENADGASNGIGSVTFAVKNAAGTSLSGQLGSVTWISTGGYRVTYTANSSDTPQELVVTCAAVVGGQTRTLSVMTLAAPFFATTFTSTDRTALNGLVTTVGAAGAGLTNLGDGRLANLDAQVSTRLPTGSYTAPPTAAAVATAVLTDAGDNTTTGTPGKILAQLAGTLVSTSSVFSGAALVNAPGGSGSDPWATGGPGSYSAGQFGQLVWTVLSAMKPFIGTAQAGTVQASPAPTASSFTVTFGGTVTAADFVGCLCKVTATDRSPGGQFVATATQVSATTVTLGFGSSPFSSAPAPNDAVVLF